MLNNDIKYIFSVFEKLIVFSTKFFLEFNRIKRFVKWLWILFLFLALVYVIIIMSKKSLTCNWYLNKNKIELYIILYKFPYFLLYEKLKITRWYLNVIMSKKI